MRKVSSTYMSHGLSFSHIRAVVRYAGRPYTNCSFQNCSFQNCVWAWFRTPWRVVAAIVKACAAVQGLRAACVKSGCWCVDCQPSRLRICRNLTGYLPAAASTYTIGNKQQHVWMASCYRRERRLAIMPLWRVVYPRLSYATFLVLSQCPVKKVLGRTWPVWSSPLQLMTPTFR